MNYADQGGTCATGTAGVDVQYVGVPTLASAFTPRNIPASAPTLRKERRALVKALGSRQFKKLYRSAP